MADDIFSHRNVFEFDENIKMIELVKHIEEEVGEYKSYGGGIWAGNYDNFKCLRDNQENLRISESIDAKKFFKGIDFHLQFERNSKRCV